MVDPVVAITCSMSRSGVNRGQSRTSLTFHRYVRAFGIDHQYDEYPGGHEWPFWDAHAVESLDFLAQHLTPATS
jgi:S-formylglutathione hydrolase FrmB